MTDELPRSAREAHEQQSKLYFTGKPCKHGHIAARYAQGRNCVECIKQTNNEWYSQNHDKHRESQRRYYLKNREALQAKGRKWYWRNRERVLEEHRLKRARNTK